MAGVYQLYVDRQVGGFELDVGFEAGVAAPRDGPAATDAAFRFHHPGVVPRVGQVPRRGMSGTREIERVIGHGEANDLRWYRERGHLMPYRALRPK
jgi:hypothetical protein